MMPQSQYIKEEEKKQEQKSKKKVSLLKKKTKPNTWNSLYQNVDIKHIVNINDLVFINQQALKDPQNSQSMFSAIFYYKMISKVAINEDYISITLKKLDQNALPPEYYLERLRSYGDSKYYNIANYLEKLKAKFQHFQDSDKRNQYINYKKQNFVLQDQIKLLEEHINSVKGKMYLMFFCEICPGGVMLKRIIISTQLLRQLGYNINQIALDFIKYKHIFFQIFTAKMYSTMIQSSLKNYATMTQSLMENEDHNSQYHINNAIYYQDEMIRKKQSNGSYQQELLSVKVKWTAPHPSVGIFQIEDIKELNVPYFSANKRIKKLQLPLIQQQLKSLQHLTKIDPSLLEQNKNRCCTFKLISETNQEKKEN